MSQTGNLEVNRGHRERIATLLGHVSRQPARSHVHEHIRASQSPSFQIFSFFFTSSSFFSASGTPPSSTCVIYPPYVCTSISCRASRPSTIQPLDLCRPSLCHSLFHLDGLTRSAMVVAHPGLPGMSHCHVRMGMVVGMGEWVTKTWMVEVKLAGWWTRSLMAWQEPPPYHDDPSHLCHLSHLSPFPLPTPTRLAP